MKRIILTLLLTISCLSFTGCFNKPYNAELTGEKDSELGGYFTVINEWYDGNGTYKIVYANDTKVMYLTIISANRSGITPLYNADGSLQIYKNVE